MSSTTFTVLSTFISPKYLADRSGPFPGATHFMWLQLSVSVAVWCWLLCFMRSFTSRSSVLLLFSQSSRYSPLSNLLSCLRNSDKRTLLRSFSRFRKDQDGRNSGLSISALKARRTRNLVSMRFNMINWFLETVSTSLVLVQENRFFTIFYLLTNSCGTPLVF